MLLRFGLTLWGHYKAAFLFIVKLIRDNRRAVGDGGENYNRLGLDNARMIFYARQQQFQRARVFGHDFQRVIKIPGDIETFFDFGFIFDERGKAVAVAGVVKAEEH